MLDRCSHLQTEVLNEANEPYFVWINLKYLYPKPTYTGFVSKYTNGLKCIPLQTHIVLEFPRSAYFASKLITSQPSVPVVNSDTITTYFSNSSFILQTQPLASTNIFHTYPRTSTHSSYTYEDNISDVTPTRLFSASHS